MVTFDCTSLDFPDLQPSFNSPVISIKLTSLAVIPCPFSLQGLNKKHPNFQKWLISIISAYESTYRQLPTQTGLYVVTSVTGLCWQYLIWNGIWDVIWVAFSQGQKVPNRKRAPWSAGPARLCWHIADSSLWSLQLQMFELFAGKEYYLAHVDCCEVCCICDGYPVCWIWDQCWSLVGGILEDKVSLDAVGWLTCSPVTILTVDYLAVHIFLIMKDLKNCKKT